MHSPTAEEAPKWSTPRCLCGLTQIKAFQLTKSQQNTNPLWSLSSVWPTELFITAFRHISAATSVWPKKVSPSPKSSEDLYENASLYRGGFPSPAPNRKHKGGHTQGWNLSLWRFYVTALTGTLRGHTLPLCTDDSKPHDRHIRGQTRIQHCTTTAPKLLWDASASMYEGSELGCPFPGTT